MARLPPCAPPLDETMLADIRGAVNKGFALRSVTPNLREDLTAKDHDKTWETKRNTGKAVHVRLQVANAKHGVSATFTIAPDGTTTYKTIAPLTATAQHFTFNGSSTFNGDMQVNGNQSISGDQSVGGDSKIGGTIDQWAILML